MSDDSTPSLLDLPPPSQQSESLASASDIDSRDEHDSDAEAEWQESLQQLELLLSMVLVPFIGKWLGRRCAFWGNLEFFS